MLLEQIVMQLPMENLYIRAFLRLFLYKVRLDVRFKRMQKPEHDSFFFPYLDLELMDLRGFIHPLWVTIERITLHFIQ